MTHLTPATARALKAAGFPQPEMKVGQIWYTQADIPCYLSAIRGDLAVFAEGTAMFDSRYLEFGKDLFLCPTAQDLMAQMTSWKTGHAVEACALKTDGLDLVFCVTINCDQSVFRHQILSETLAKAYLALHPAPAP